MKKVLTLIIACLITVTLAAGSSFAGKREKFGEDPRHKTAKRVSFKPSDKKIRWKMVMPWSKGLLFYDIAVHFTDSVRLASAGRLDIKPFSAGELVPAMQSFDAVSKGSAQVGHDWPGYWKGKNEAFVAFGDVPFGLDPEGYNVWLYEQGGIELLQELYGKFNLYALPGGQTGQDMGLFSNKKATKMEDFKGLRIRTPGWYMDIMNSLGASVSPLPGGEVYLALERGVIDAAEFSAPAINYPMGFDDITKYAIQPGVHQPGGQCNLFFNMDAWNKLPEDLKYIVKICAKETQLWSLTWINNLNSKAMEKFKEKVEIVQMEKETLIQFRKTTQAYLETLKEKYPDVKKVLESQEKFKQEYSVWRKAKSGVAPWPYETYISGEISQ
ncbi:TRAP-type mannitol/chloroaromatic compound transport system, substrate-binding protein [Desulfocicer vacuolatum DSM 3385]|uniref:TRAP-type mannitol/chloroaromatic compound transport system, substrate-binding protein n=1 Tax=Desulfocicer vacuolatum DSM 3385 TaxID=1121400 RepID=A0A1W2CMA4_9BACT|nr:TRAP transporter substrate-binding protein DctP [Desulfocicer vacuolatum]SMC86104.1 TRAP-type mannitol/chloroaromatic compound transport system, substrate-binding protein [Desulfocicer vacuolatum DSM 3385]